MRMCVFLSSTREDLNADCRPSVLTGMQFGEVELVEMDTWDTDHVDPVSLCQCKIRDQSSHYLGLFAHRRGWVPQTLGKSITEAEYDWAIEHRGLLNMAVFLPLPGTELDLALRERARSQPPADDLAQKAFLDRVRLRSCQQFKTLQELSSRVTRKLWSWKGGGLRAMAAVAAAPPPSRPRPTDEDLASFGRRRHQLQFEETLELLGARPAHRLASFLVHGPKGHGHDELVSRLRRLLEKSTQNSPRHLILHLGVPWQGNDQSALLASLARKLGLEATVSLVDLGKDLEAALKTSDVVLEVRQAQKFDGGLANLIANFWQPLAAAVKQPCSCRLICLITAIEDAAPDAPGLLQSAPQPDCVPGDFDPAAVIRLPRLDPFTRGEIALWTPKWFPNPEAVAQHLHDETRGQPADLFNLLKDDAFWTA